MKRLLALGLLAIAPIAHASDFKIDSEHTYIIFEVLHNNTSTVRGQFNNVDGKLQFDPKAQTGGAQITIDMSSINTGSDGFNEHLRNKDFFDTTQHPQAQFISTIFHFEDDKVKQVDGNLTMLGQTHPVKIEAIRFNCYQNKRIDKEVCGGDFTAEIERSQWGMGFGLPNIPDLVKLQIEIEAVRQ